MVNLSECKKDYKQPLLKKFKYTISIVVILLITQAIVMSLFIKEFIIEKQIQANKNYINSIMYNIDNQFNEITASIYNMMNTENYYIYINNFKQYSNGFSQNVKNLSLDLKNIKSNNSIIDEILVCNYNKITGDTYAFSEKGTYDISTYFNEIDKLINVKQDDVFKMFCENFSLRLTESEKKYGNKEISMINLIIKNKYQYNNARWILVDLNEKKLFDNLESLNITKNGYVYFLDAKNQKLIGDRDKLHINTYGNINLLLNGIDKKSNEIIINDKKCIFSFKKSSIDDIYYIVLTPNELITEGINKFIINTIKVFVVFLIGIIIIVTIFSKRTYLPIIHTLNDCNKLIKNNENINGDNLEGITDGIKELKTIQNKSKTYLMQMLLYRAINDNLTTEEYEKFLIEYNLSLSLPNFYILILRIENHNKINFDLFDFKYLFIGIGEFLEISKYEYIIMLNVKDSNDLNIKLMKVKDIIMHCNKKYKNEIEIFSGISNVFDNIISSHEYYQQAINNLDMRNINLNKVIYKKCDRGNEECDILTESIRKALLNNLLDFNENKVFEVINYVKNESRKNNVTLMKYRQGIVELMSIVLDALISLNLNNEEKTKEILEIIKTVNKIQNVEILDDKCEYVFKEFVKNFNKTEDTITLILNYIDENIKDIYLDKVAMSFNMNTNYLSQYFKKHTGETFSQYVNKKKISLAVIKLVETDMKIDEIAREAGFGSNGAFIRMFKQIEGITPSGYRNLYKK